MEQVILKRFEIPDEIISFEKGRFEKITLGGVTIGRATYEPGWKWSTDFGSKTRATLCQVEHVGLVVAVELPQRCRMDQLSKCEPAICFTSHQGMIAGSSAMRIMFLSTSSARVIRSGIAAMNSSSR